MDSALIANATADAFLLELVNLRRAEDDRGSAVKRFTRRFRDLLPGYPEEPSDTRDIREMEEWFEPGVQPPQQPWRDKSLRGRELVRRRLEYWADQLHYVWTRETPEFRETAMIVLLFYYFAEAGFNFSRRAKRNSFREILKRVFKVTGRMRRCGNPECPAPFFLAIRRGQVYCSAVCAGPAHQAVKNRWWREKGAAWLRRRRARAKRKTRAPQKGGK